MKLTDKEIQKNSIVFYTREFKALYEFFNLLHQHYPECCYLSSDMFEKAFSFFKGKRLSKEERLVKEVEFERQHGGLFFYGLKALQLAFEEHKEDFICSHEENQQEDWWQVSGREQVLEQVGFPPEGVVLQAFLIENALQKPLFDRISVVEYAPVNISQLHPSVAVSQTLYAAKKFESVESGVDQLVSFDRENNRRYHQYYELIGQMNEGMAYMIACNLSYDISFCHFSHPPESHWLKKFLWDFQSTCNSPADHVLQHWFQIQQQVEWAFFPDMPDWDCDGECLIVCRDETAKRKLLAIVAQIDGLKLTETSGWSNFFLNSKEELAIKTAPFRDESATNYFDDE